MPCIILLTARTLQLLHSVPYTTALPLDLTEGGAVRRWRQLVRLDSVRLVASPLSDLQFVRITAANAELPYTDSQCYTARCYSGWGGQRVVIVAEGCSAALCRIPAVKYLVCCTTVNRQLSTSLHPLTRQLVFLQHQPTNQNGFDCCGRVHTPNGSVDKNFSYQN